MTTDYLVEKSNGLFQISSENTDSRYSKHDDGGVEVEVGEFLYGLVRLLKPQNILETGTYSGISAMYMAQALKENKSGQITTLEIDQEHKLRAEKLWKQVEVEATCLIKKSLDYIPYINEYDFMFLDSEPAIRWKELEKFYPYLKPGGFVFLHDLPRGFCKGNVNSDHPEIVDWPWGEVPETIKELLKSGNLKPWHFPNPREMCGFYKSHPDDYERKYL